MDQLKHPDVHAIEETNDDGRMVVLGATCPVCWGNPHAKCNVHSSADHYGAGYLTAVEAASLAANLLREREELRAEIAMQKQRAERAETSLEMTIAEVNTLRAEIVRERESHKAHEALLLRAAEEQSMRISALVARGVAA